MRAVPTTEAKSRFAELLRVVEYGQSIAITRHGKTVTRLVSAVGCERVLQRAAVERFRARRRQWRRIDMTTEEILASIAKVDGDKPLRTSRRWTMHCYALPALRGAR